MSTAVLSRNEDSCVYISAKEASMRLGVSQNTLRHWRYTGLRDDLLPYKSRIDRRVVYKEDDVENFKKNYLFQ